MRIEISIILMGVSSITSRTWCKTTIPDIQISQARSRENKFRFGQTSEDAPEVSFCCRCLHVFTRFFTPARYGPHLLLHPNAIILYIAVPNHLIWTDINPGGGYFYQRCGHRLRGGGVMLWPYYTMLALLVGFAGVIGVSGCASPIGFSLCSCSYMYACPLYIFTLLSLMSSFIIPILTCSMLDLIEDTKGETPLAMVRKGWDREIVDILERRIGIESVNSDIDGWREIVR